MATAYDKATLRVAAGAACVKEVYEYQASKSSCVPVLDQTRVLGCLANQHTTGRCCSCLVHCVIEAL